MNGDALCRIATEAGLGENLGAEARAEVERRFDVRGLGRRLAELYREVAG